MQKRWEGVTCAARWTDATGEVWIHVTPKSTFSAMNVNDIMLNIDVPAVSDSRLILDYSANAITGTYEQCHPK